MKVQRILVAVFNTDILLFYYRITVNFIDRSGVKHTVKAEVGDSLLDVIINEELNFESFGKYYFYLGKYLIFI